MVLHVVPLIVALAGSALPQSAGMPAQQARSTPATQQAAASASTTRARPLLDAALAQAKREDKVVFLWFSAEW